VSLASVLLEARVRRRVNPDEAGMIYVLHFEPAYEHARHYIGFTTKSGDERAHEHGGHNGSPLVRAARAAGSTVVLVAEFPGTRAEERKLKESKNTRRFCPRCKPDYNDEVAARMRRIRQNRKDRARRLAAWIGPSS
jgi:hypothetical protein